VRVSNGAENLVWILKSLYAELTPSRVSVVLRFVNSAWYVQVLITRMI